jgi:4-amino-4-deoxy-L-arabinose transferase-like glycosyltransferase
MRFFPISKLELALLCIIVLLAAWLRLDSLDQVELLWDQAEISKCGLRMAREGEIAWTGTLSSTGLHFFMGAAWLMAIPYALSPSPVFATGFVAVINLAAVIGCYFLARRWFGRIVALVAALLFAVGPWAVVYSRRIWHLSFLPPFVLIYVVTGWQAFVRERRWAYLAHGLALAALVQLHFSAVSFVLLTLLWALVFRKRLDWQGALAGGLLAILTFVPYFVVDAQRDWRNVRRFTGVIQQPATTDADAAYATWVITTGSDLHWLTGPDRYQEFLRATPNARWLFAVEGGLAVAGGIVALWWATRRARRGLDDEAAAVLMTVTWLAMPALFLTRHNRWVAPHYFTTTFPAQFILVGWLVDRVGRVSGRVARAGWGLLLALVLALAAAQVYETVSVLQFVTTHDTPQGYGTPVSYEIQAVQTATHLSQEMGGTEVILLSEGEEPGRHEMPAAADVLMYGAPHRSVDIRTTLVFPASPVAYWATYDLTPGEELLGTLSPEVVEERILLREGIHSYRFYRWSGGLPPIPDLHPLPSPPFWANGAQLVGYRVEGDARPGTTVRWTLVWQVVHAPPEDVYYYHWFNHLLDGEGQLRGQQDGPSFLTQNWRVGDTILNWFDVQIPTDAPPGEYTMRVGMYAYPAIANVPLLDTNGEPEGEWAEIGPLWLEE